jgi:hypothetical protein
VYKITPFHGIGSFANKIEKQKNKLQNHSQNLREWKTFYKENVKNSHFTFKENYLEKVSIKY